MEVDDVIRPSPDVHVAFIFTQPENSEGTFHQQFIVYFFFLSVIIFIKVSVVFQY